METKRISMRKIASFCNDNKALSCTVLFFVVTNVLAMFSSKFEAPCVSCSVTRTLSEFGGCSYDAVPFSTLNSFKVMVCCFLSAFVLQFEFLKKRKFVFAMDVCAFFGGENFVKRAPLPRLDEGWKNVARKFYWVEQ